MKKMRSWSLVKWLAALGLVWMMGGVASAYEVSAAIAGIKLPYKNATTRALWVSPTGSDAAAGTQDDPLRTIMAAVKRATPGTAILVREGTYQGSVVLDGVHGTPDAPIVLVSADGIGKARIVGAVDNAAIKGNRVSNIGIYGFHIHASVPLENCPDIGGLKLFSGAFTNSSVYPTPDPAENLVIAGNTITGTGRDGLKLFGGAMNVLIIGNTIDGDWHEEAIDFVSVETTTVAYNTIAGKARYTGFTQKSGSQANEVFGNLFTIKAGRAIHIGGQGRLTYRYPEHWQGFEAKNIHVHHNVVSSGTGNPAWFQGAHDCILEYNYLPGRIGSSANSSPGQPTHYSYNNIIRHNSVSREDYYRMESPADEENAKGYVFENNTVSDAKPPAGADLPEVEAFLRRLMEEALPH